VSDGEQNIRDQFRPTLLRAELKDGACRIATASRAKISECPRGLREYLVLTDCTQSRTLSNS
jgi:hypothetical protein